MSTAKRIVVIQGHPNPAGDRLGHALANAYIESAKTAGHQVTLIDTAHLEIPFLRSQQEYDRGPIPPGLVQPRQAFFSADHIVVFFPLWLNTMPALLKAFFEQTLRPDPLIGEAKPDFKAFQTRLKGISVRVVVTMGMPAFIFRWIFGSYGVRVLTRGMLRICGAKPIRTTLLGKVDGVTPAIRKQWLDQMARLGKRAN